MSDPNLVTTCNFNGREYFMKMNTSNKILELLVTDKLTDIESITKKTGNFKQFDIFVAMLKSGLLKTSHCVSLDLLTFEDLDALRNHRIRGPSSTFRISQSNKNRRYVILTYSVEFDRIHYPLPLEYCGRPDPEILQQHVLRLEEEIVQLNEQLQRQGTTKSESRLIVSLHKQIEDLTDENQDLQAEIKRLHRQLERRPQASRHRVNLLQSALKDLEHTVLTQKQSHQQIVQRLLADKVTLARELDRVRSNERVHRDQIRPAGSQVRSRERPMKKALNPGPSGDSRSPSPRVYKADHWNSTSTARKSRCTRPRARQRSNSRSDSETSEKRYNVLPAKANATKPLHKMQPAGPVSSRSNSASSRSSSASSKRGPKPGDGPRYSSTTCHIQKLLRSVGTPAKRTPSRNTDLDFSSLENRMQTLQAMINTSLPFK